jgi:hypothetical protein
MDVALHEGNPMIRKLPQRPFKKAKFFSNPTRMLWEGLGICQEKLDLSARNSI